MDRIVIEINSTNVKNETPSRWKAGKNENKILNEPIGVMIPSQFVRSSMIPLNRFNWHDHEIHAEMYHQALFSPQTSIMRTYKMHRLEC